MANNTILTKIKAYFTTASTRENLTSGEDLQTSLGKVKKWFSDLGTAAFTNSTDYAASSHTQASSTITAMTGYSKPQSTSAITASDTLNQAIGKLEKGLDGAGGGGETIPPIVINRLSNTSTSSSASGNITVINFDPTLIESHPIKFKIKSGTVSQSTLENNKWVYSGPQILTVEVIKHGYVMQSYPSLSSEPIYTKSAYFINIEPSKGSREATVYDFSGGSFLSKSPYLTSVTFGNNYMEFYVQYVWKSGSTNNYSQTLLESIQPIDFTAVTSITHGGVTVWERT